MESTNRRWLAWALVALIAASHFVFMALEMFAWTWTADRVAGLKEEIAEATKSIGANQGLYNGFLAAGLVWSLSWGKRPMLNRKLAMFFVTCVLVAGVFGALTIKFPNFRLLVGQALPALIALVVLWKLPTTTDVAK